MAANSGKAWLLIENEETGEREPDGQGNWIPKVRTRVLAGTYDPNAANALLEALKTYIEKQDKITASQTLIAVDAVSIPQALNDIIQEDPVEGLLKKIKL